MTNEELKEKAIEKCRGLIHKTQKPHIINMSHVVRAEDIKVNHHWDFMRDTIHVNSSDNSITVKLVLSNGEVFYTVPTHFSEELNKPVFGKNDKSFVNFETRGLLSENDYSVLMATFDRYNHMF